MLSIDNKMLTQRYLKFIINLNRKGGQDVRMIECCFENSNKFYSAKD